MTTRLHKGEHFSVASFDASLPSACTFDRLRPAVNNVVRDEQERVRKHSFLPLVRLLPESRRSTGCSLVGAAKAYQLAVDGRATLATAMLLPNAML